MFDSILIANRGEIACRIIRTARAMGIRTIAVYSEADRGALHVDMASDAVEIGPAPSAESYLNQDAILAAIEETGAEAVHPGYGFLSENAGFAETLGNAGVTFIGPPINAINLMGDKIRSKLAAEEAGVPVVPGFADPVTSGAEAERIAADIGFPVMLKASAGGGGKGMRLVEEGGNVAEALASCISEAEASFGDGRVFIEKFITNPRHIEIQVLADAHGNVIHLGERECSIQRRHQKVVEEAPSPFVTEELRAEMGARAVALAEAVDYVSTGTVEFIADADRNFYFLEMNTRLQVEHPVTEFVTGLDLVEQMIRIAAGEELQITQSDVTMTGWAMESRVYAEDPVRGFLPAIGRLTRYKEPMSGVFGTDKSVRIDSGASEGDTISRFYDPMIAKLITYGENRDAAIAKMRRALDEFIIAGVTHNADFLAALMGHSRFQSGELTTNFIAEEFGDRFIPGDTTHPRPKILAAVAGVLNGILEARRAVIAPRSRDGLMAGRAPMKQDDQWVVILNHSHYPVRLAETNGDAVVVVGGERFTISGSWSPEQDLFSGAVNGEDICIQVDRTDNGFQFRHYGFLADIRILRPLAAEMLGRMPEKTDADTSNLVLSPMPGLVVSIDVSEGQEVRLGDKVAVIEAMKMENQLFAECDGAVAKIHCQPGESVDVDQVIMEFE
ncbi:MAG: acetyl/propionyl/methylcrotonyl-CoA carboxylase subunit alpha [Rhodospirillaceae bacterium]|jgi:propionyl-CoA carboxylase alpha chain|nr:acetyl/propionyl/methylcrotonyl-CoA carboxylase subunit alpha [Rhodospirillaceae bacterium]MBT3887254.1 acetyl/propionyl/methylcrotonyl-CoA carboxylase subunit alpha [Rhodospirillaceae bacterium]MBT4117250.1 acetyl/propionyl/methylcrotonyl-CoA carboxylase subunit alpha [Rhodospirillaceae bacterium]MBT4674883.1 acetyl/propionyl/methylcrotonyl-CoA carboxylase subunit alpha [Rhodospirillaceae bacterium]MBT4718661.1 acetyl/propionyl/methylcrotonyl-CoA carboxylase subunit alpha [Rhodospirillaceae